MLLFIEIPWMVLFLQELACFALFCQYIQYLWVLVGCGGWWVVGKFLYDWHLGGFGRFIAFLRYSFSCNISLMEFVSQKFKCTLYISSSCCYLFPIKVKDPYFCFVDNGSYYRNCLYFHFRLWHSLKHLTEASQPYQKEMKAVKIEIPCPNIQAKWGSDLRLDVSVSIPPHWSLQMICHWFPLTFDQALYHLSLLTLISCGALL